VNLNPESKVLEGKIFRALRIRCLEILVRGHPAVIRGSMGGRESKRASMMVSTLQTLQAQISKWHSATHLLDFHELLESALVNRFARIQARASSFCALQDRKVGGHLRGAVLIRMRGVHRRKAKYYASFQRLRPWNKRNFALFGEVIVTSRSLASAMVDSETSSAILRLSVSRSPGTAGTFRD